jgi:hypothetical protein
MASSAGVSRETGRNTVTHRIGPDGYGIQRSSEHPSRQAPSADSSVWTCGREPTCQALAGTHSDMASRIQASQVPLTDAAHVMQPGPAQRPSAALKLRSSQHPWCGPSAAGPQYAPPTQLALAESVRSRGLPHHRHHHPWQHRGFHGARRAPHRRPAASIDCYAVEDQLSPPRRSMRTPVLTRFAATRQPPGEWARPAHQLVDAGTSARSYDQEDSLDEHTRTKGRREAPAARRTHELEPGWPSTSGEALGTPGTTLARGSCRRAKPSGWVTYAGISKLAHR